MLWISGYWYSHNNVCLFVYIKCTKLTDTPVSFQYDNEVVRVSKDPLGLDSLKRLEVQVPSRRGGVDLVVVTTLMKQSPQLREFRIEVNRFSLIQIFMYSYHWNDL